MPSAISPLERCGTAQEVVTVFSFAQRDAALRKGADENLRIREIAMPDQFLWDGSAICYDLPMEAMIAKTEL